VLRKSKSRLSRPLFQRFVVLATVLILAVQFGIGSNAGAQTPPASQPSVSPLLIDLRLPTQKVDVAGGKVRLGLIKLNERQMTKLNVGSELINIYLKDRMVKWLLVIAGENDRKKRVELFRQAMSWLKTEIYASRQEISLATKKDAKNAFFDVMGSALLLEQEIDRMRDLQATGHRAARYIPETPEAEKAFIETVQNARQRLEFTVEVRPLGGFFWMPESVKQSLSLKEFHLLAALVDRGDQGRLLRERIQGLNDKQVLEMTDALGGGVRKYMALAEGKALGLMNLFKFKSEKQTHVVQLVLKTYLQETSLAQKLRYVARVAQDAPNLNEDGVRKAVLSASGPMLRKALQIFARQPGLDEKAAALAVTFEDADTEVPFDIFEKKYAGTGLLEKFEKIDRHAAAAASVAQLHQAWIRENGKLIKTGFRDIKPGTEILVAEEERVFQKVIEVLEKDPLLNKHGVPSLKPALEQMMDMAKREMDLQQTWKHQILADQLYHSDFSIAGQDGRTYTVNIRAPKVHHIVSGEHELYVQEWSEGKRFDDLLKSTTQPDAVRSVVRNSVAQHFYTHAFVTTKLVHGDLHMGNMLMTLNDDESNPVLVIDVLDMGIFEKISDGIAKGLIRLFAGIELNNAPLVIDELMALQDQKKPLERETIETLVNSIFKNPAYTSGQARAKELFPRLSTINYPMPYEALIFLRSHIALEVATFDPNRKESLVMAFIRGLAADPVKLARLAVDVDVLGLLASSGKLTFNRVVSDGQYAAQKAIDVKNQVQEQIRQHGGSAWGALSGLAKNVCSAVLSPQAPAKTGDK
jgi:predicted unusual protein kinase regulating ubiquinone biosynthesis (AarF/ABC1/UbiB family)